MDPGDCLAGIGPSVGPCCYEVDESVMGPFQDSFRKSRIWLFPFPLRPVAVESVETNRRTLLDAGLKAENIVSSQICTSCHQQYFFFLPGSEGKYRPDGGSNYVKMDLQAALLGTVFFRPATFR